MMLQIWTLCDIRIETSSAAIVKKKIEHENYEASFILLPGSILTSNMEWSCATNGDAQNSNRAIVLHL